MFGHDVRGVLGPCNLDKVNGAGPDLFLRPQVSNIEMPDLAEPSASADADGGRSVRVDADLEMKSKIAAQTLEPETLGDTRVDAMQLGLAGTEGQSGLGLGPRLDKGPGKECDSS